MPHGLPTRERFPARDRALHVLRIEIQRVTGSPEFFRGHDRRPAAAERIEDRVVHAGVIEDWDLEQAHGLLGAMAGDRVLAGARAAERIQVRDFQTVVCRRSPHQCPLPRTAYKRARGPSGSHLG